MSADQITLHLPRERGFFGIAHLVVGGLAARMDLGYEQLEDLQVALAELLEQHETDEEITVNVRVENDTVHASVGPFDASLARDLARDGDDAPSLRRVLETVVDTVEVNDRDGQPWVELRKAVVR